MRKVFLTILCMWACWQAYGQNYQFNGTMSRQVLDNYLDRSITMQGQSDVEGAQLLSEPERLRNVAMLNDIGAKFVGRIGGWWESGWGQGQHDAIFAKVSQNVADIHANDPDVICQAAVFEYVSNTVGTVAVPARVFQEFGLPVTNRTFNYAAMLYPAPASQYKIYGRDMTEDERLTTPDITQLETQMWFYYMATRYIESGCEAIHFGQTEIMSRRDVGNHQWWMLLQRVRYYAQLNARRHLVVCDAHVTGIGTYYDPNLNISQAQWQTYTPSQDWQKQLLWDFHSMWVGYQEDLANCTGGRQPVTLNPQPNAGLHRRSLGGVHPQGWLCRRNAYLVELDNGGVDDAVGCGYNRNHDWTTYGWDEISWFALQPEWYRNNILSYTYYKVKCMDLNGHFEMPGMRGVTPGNGQTGFLYRANTGIHNQQVTIKNLWNGSYSPNQNWVKHNFSDEQVANSPNPGIAGNNLIFVGNNRMYYIGTDSRVHGYVRYNGTWLTTSPSYSAAGNNSVNYQVPASGAAGSLVANPSGTALYYIGTDGFVYQFQIVDDWTYTYSALPANSAMQQQNIRAVGSLLCPTDGRMYYVAREAGNGNAQRVHAFIYYGGTWTTTSPSWAAGNPANQAQAANDLVINPSGTTLYYRGTDGFLYQFQIIDEWTYSYAGLSTNASMQQQNIRAIGGLKCPTNSRLYYIARELSNSNAQRVHGLIYSGGSWATTSPTWAAVNTPAQSQVQALTYSLACSPDNSTLAYIGNDYQMHGFSILNDWQYSYFDFQRAQNYQTGVGLTLFNAQNELFYISAGWSYSDHKVQQYVFAPDYCGSAYVQNTEPGCCNYGRATRSDSLANLAATQLEQAPRKPAATEVGVNVYPNPTKDVLNIAATAGISRVTIMNVQGQVCLEKRYDAQTGHLQIAVGALPAGLYFVTIDSEAGSIKKKMVIAH